MPPVLPLDVLREIFRYCDTKNITEASSYFASIAHSIPSLWSRIRIGQHQVIPEGIVFFSYRLNRAGADALQVSIGPLDRDANLDAVNKFCRLLSNFNNSISRFEITAETAMLTGMLIEKIFPTGIYPNLLYLSIRVEDDEALDDEYFDEHDKSSPRLDRYLSNVAERFPSLQTLSLPTFYDSLPMVPKKAPFSYLHTLVLDGAWEHDPPSIVLVVALLRSTPQLETLWFKHVTDDHFSFIPDVPAIPLLELVKDDRTDVRGSLFLPRLTNLAVTAPGCALDIILSINAPELRNLHIDGSRGPMRGSNEPFVIDWNGFNAQDIINCLKRLSLQSKQLRRLAFTSAHVSHADWKWLFFGNAAEGLPFPLLESIALNGIEDIPDGEQFGFNDALLRSYARDSRLPLRRLAIRRCNFQLSGAVLAQAFGSVLSSVHAASYELEFCHSCPQVKGDELDDVLAAGDVKLIRADEIIEDAWWARGHDIDPLDLHAY